MKLQVKFHAEDLIFDGAKIHRTPIYRKTFIRASRVRNLGTRFFCAPNNMFTCRIVYYKFRSPQIVVCARVYTNIPHHAPTTKKKIF